MRFPKIEEADLNEEYTPLGKNNLRFNQGPKKESNEFPDF